MIDRPVNSGTGCEIPRHEASRDARPVRAEFRCLYPNCPRWELRHGLLVLALLLAIAAPALAADQTQSEQGRAIYQKWCTPCHGTGLGKPGTAAAAAHGAKPAVLEERADLTPKVIETAVRNGLNFMPRFRKTEVSNADLAAIVAYLTHK